MAADVVRDLAYSIRLMCAGDTTAVSRLLSLTPEAVVWPEPGIKEVLDWPGVVAMVVESEGAFAGFLLARQVADEAEILNLAIEERNRRRGLATALLLGAQAKLQFLGAKRLFLEVRASNRAAISFYLRHGFSDAGRRTRYYRDPVEDALILQKPLAG